MAWKPPPLEQSLGGVVCVFTDTEKREVDRAIPSVRLKGQCNIFSRVQLSSLIREGNLQDVDLYLVLWLPEVRVHRLTDEFQSFHLAVIEVESDAEVYG